jgi:tetratricopeptide (TPR) repeat protein
VLKDLGEYAEAEALLRESLAIFEALPGGSRRGLHATQIGIANILRRTGRLDEAAAMLGADRELGGDGFDTPYAQRLLYLELTRLHLARGHVADARRSLEDFYTVVETTGSTVASDSPELLALQAELQLAEGHASLAIPLIERALAAQVERWGAEHWQVGVTRVTLGRALLDNGQHDAAVAELTAAQLLLQRVLGDDHPSSVEAAIMLAAAGHANSNNNSH